MERKKRSKGSVWEFCYANNIHVIMFWQCGYTSLQNSADLSSALVLFNAMMVMAARDRPSAAESDFLCRHTHTHCTHSSRQYAVADCDPTRSQIWTRIGACLLHEFEPSFGDCTMTNLTIHGAHNLKWHWSWHQVVGPTVHLVGHKRQLRYCCCPSEDVLICFNFASPFGEYLKSLVISWVVSRASFMILLFFMLSEAARFIQWP